jgi:hypothetical protein
MENWKEKFAALKNEYNKNHHFMSAKDEILCFVAEIFKANKSNSLSLAEMKDLESIDFDFSAKGKNWDKWWANYQELTSLSKIKPISHISQLDEQIGTWISAQRVAYRQKLLGKKKILLLEHIGFNWNPMCDKEKGWSANLSRLKEFHEAHGHFLITKVNTDSKFCSWAYAQKTAFRKNIMKECRAKILIELGFIHDK